MTTKKVLLALAASSLFAFASVAPVWAEDPPPSNDGATMPVPPDPESAETGDIAPLDPGTDEGAAGDASGAESGTEGGEPPPQPE